MGDLGRGEGAGAGIVEPLSPVRSQVPCTYQPLKLSLLGLTIWVPRGGGEGHRGAVHLKAIIAGLAIKIVPVAGRFHAPLGDMIGVERAGVGEGIAVGIDGQFRRIGQGDAVERRGARRGGQIGQAVGDRIRQLDHIGAVDADQPVRVGPGRWAARTAGPPAACCSSKVGAAVAPAAASALAPSAILSPVKDSAP